jgi:hypothetical protein
MLSPRVIGLAYTIGSQGPTYREAFDLAARLGFELLAARHPGEIRALTDTLGAGVTTRSLRALVRDCDFVFYWGHGSSSRRDGATLEGTAGEVIPLVALGSCVDKHLYLDGCDIARHLGADNFPEALVLAPARVVDYPVSIRAGCSLMRSLFRARRTFRSACGLAKESAGPSAAYKLVGSGRDHRVPATPEARRSLARLFDDLERVGATG